MPARLIDSVRRINRTRAPENSIIVRVAVLSAVCCGVLALAAVEVVAAQTTALILLVLPLAYWISYSRRAEDNFYIKIVIAIAAVAVLGRFFTDVGRVASLDEIRFPLAEVFLWVQVLHSFDLPERKDLHFSLGSSLALMAIAGSVSQDLLYGAFLVVYLVLAVWALVLLHRSELGRGTVGALRPRRGVPVKKRPGEIWRSVLAVGAAAIVVFLVLPQPTAVRAFALPFQFGGGGSPAGGGIVSPGFEGAAGSRSAAANFHGLSSEMDLRVRGDLPDELVMRVRASSPAMWRGMIFDAYDGVRWKGDESDPVRLEGEPVNYPIQLRDLGPRATVTQTFYLEVELPNMVFAAAHPDTVWIGEGVNVDSNGSLRTDATLTAGGVYSVVSSRGAATADQLRAAGEPAASAELERYLQIPRDLPERVGDLAREITATAPTTYDKVRAIEDYIEANYEYSTRSPVPPPGRDAVDHFLFDTDAGFCEQFASATVIMLRSLGVPARVAVGYTPGTRNPFTGYYEVKADNAHSWVEVYFPRFGWYEFDPTVDVPPAREDLMSTVPLARAMTFLGERLGDIDLGDTGGLVRTATVMALAGIAVWAAVVGRRRFSRRVPAAPVSKPHVYGSSGPVGRAFARVEEALAIRRKPRGSSETARETLARAEAMARRDPGGAAAIFEKERYGRQPPDPEDIAGAVAELDELARAVANSRPRRG